MVNSIEKSNILSRKLLKKYHLEYNEISELILEINKKHEIESDIEKSHPLTRAFINLEANREILRKTLIEV